jgi:glucose-6-phosphate 1-epimerase
MAQGVVFHHGAQVVDWTPFGHEPVLWLSDKTAFDSHSPIRGGIPICWPWFGAGINGVSFPLHGFGRLSEWRLVSSTENEDTVSARYILVNASPDKFNYSYCLTYDVTFGLDFSATLNVRNTGDTRFVFEESLHTYLRVGDVRQTVIKGLNGAPYLDRVAGHFTGPHTQSTDLMITEETDRIFHTTGDIVIQDPTMDREIFLSRKGSQDVIVWNPWIEKAKSLPDMSDDGWTSMICVETANVGEHAISLSPGRDHSISFSLRVGPL